MGLRADIGGVAQGSQAAAGPEERDSQRSRHSQSSSASGGTATLMVWTRWWVSASRPCGGERLQRRRRGRPSAVRTGRRIGRRRGIYRRRRLRAVVVGDGPAGGGLRGLAVVAEGLRRRDLDGRRRHRRVVGGLRFGKRRRPVAGRSCGGGTFSGVHYRPEIHHGGARRASVAGDLVRLRYARVGAFSALLVRIRSAGSLTWGRRDAAEQSSPAGGGRRRVAGLSGIGLGSAVRVQTTSPVPGGRHREGAEAQQTGEATVEMDSPGTKLAGNWQQRQARCALQSRSSIHGRPGTAVYTGAAWYQRSTRPPKRKKSLRPEISGVHGSRAPSQPPA